ncbi:MAG: hypothetical protein R3F14_26195 [Polyangiaceae bacterium]
METGYIVPPGSSGVARTELPQQKSEIAAHFDVSDALWGFVAKAVVGASRLVPPILIWCCRGCFRRRRGSGR